jgi:hypothetical protein
MNFSGYWRLDSGASTFHGPVPSALLMMIEHDEPALTQHIIATDPTGREQRRVFACRAGEETIASIGETTLRCHAYWQDAELIIETTMSRQGNDLRFKDCWSLSSDGATLTMAHRDDALAGQTVILIRDDGLASAFNTGSTPA